MRNGAGRLWALAGLGYARAALPGMGLEALRQAALCAGYAFVFGVLLRLSGGPHALRAYLPFLLAGLAAWFYYQEALLAALDTPGRYAPLLRAGLCRPALLCAGSVLGALPLHILWMALAALAGALLQGGLPPRAWAAAYYLLCGLCNAFAQGLCAAAFAPFFREARRGGVATLALVFWTTPVVWPEALLPEAARRLLWVNPLYYAVKGMRSAFCLGAPAPEATQAWCFWGITVATAAAGLWLTARLKNKYGEVL